MLGGNKMTFNIKSKSIMTSFRIDDEYALKLAVIQKKMRISKTDAIKKGIDAMYESVLPKVK